MLPEFFSHSTASDSIFGVMPAQNGIGVGIQFGVNLLGIGHNLDEIIDRQRIEYGFLGRILACLESLNTSASVPNNFQHIHSDGSHLVSPSGCELLRRYRLVERVIDFFLQHQYILENIQLISRQIYVC